MILPASFSLLALPVALAVTAYSQTSDDFINPDRGFYMSERLRPGILSLCFDLLDGNSRKNESEECECVAARFGDYGGDRYAGRFAQPRDQGGGSP
jgi:hypothetical protein